MLILQRLLDMRGDYAAENEIALNCNKITGVLICPQKYKQLAPSNDFPNGVRVQFSDHVKYLVVLINASLKDDDDIHKNVKSLCCAAYKLRWTFDQCFSALKTFCFVPIARQCMLANCGANAHKLEYSACALPTEMLPNYALHTQKCK